MESGDTRMAAVMVADGDRASRQELAAALRRWGYDSETLETGCDVLERVREGRAPLLITEAHLPDTDAWVLLPKVHRLAPDLPVIVISADDSWDTSRRVRVEGAPVFFYEPKPVDMKQMQRVVCSAIEWTQRRGSARIRAAEEREAQHTEQEDATAPTPAGMGPHTRGDPRVSARRHTSRGGPADSQAAEPGARTRRRRRER